VKFTVKKTAHISVQYFCSVFLFSISVQYFRCGAHPASYSVDVGDSVLAGKAAGAWGWFRSDIYLFFLPMTQTGQRQPFHFFPYLDWKY